MRTLTRVTFAALLVVLAGCQGAGMGPELHEKSVASFRHGQENLVNYSVNLLSAMVTERVAAMTAEHETNMAAALAANDAQKALSLERYYQATLVAIEGQVRDEFTKIDAMAVDFTNGFRLAEVVQKALDRGGEVDWDKVVSLISAGAEAAEKAGIKLGKLGKALRALDDAKKLPKVQPAPIVPVEE